MRPTAPTFSKPLVKPNWELVEAVSLALFEEPIRKIFYCLDALAFDANDEDLR